MAFAPGRAFEILLTLPTPQNEINAILIEWIVSYVRIESYDVIYNKILFHTITPYLRYRI